MNEAEAGDRLVAEGVLVDNSRPDGRVTWWLPADRDAEFRYWERVSAADRPAIVADVGIDVVPASAKRFRQRVDGSLDERLATLTSAAPIEVSELPTGETVVSCGSDRADLAIVRATSDRLRLDAERIRTHWPTAERVREIGPGVFLVAGVAPGSAERDSPPENILECPRARAAQLLAAARASGDRRAEASTLTDLAVMSINEGDSQRAIDRLKEALQITRELGDAGAEADVTGNFGLLSLKLENPGLARQLFEKELALARAAGDRFAETAALERLGLALVRLGDHARALEHFDAALALARAMGDRQHEAALIWQQAVAHAEAGRRDRAVAAARSAVELARAVDGQQGDLLAAHLKAFCDDGSDRVVGGAVTVSAGLPDPGRQSVGGRGPGLLRKGLAAARSVTRFIASGLKTADPDVVRERLRACSACAQHTGLRCRVCGCFTNVKTRMALEVCPAGKWPA